MNNTRIPAGNFYNAGSSQLSPTASSSSRPSPRGSSSARNAPPALSGLPPAPRRANLSQWLSPEELRLNRQYKNETLTVETRTLHNLNTAATVIGQVERRLPHGSGNQWAALVGTQGESYARYDQMRDA